jgi:hypothetical protein
MRTRRLCHGFAVGCLIASVACHPGDRRAQAPPAIVATAAAMDSVGGAAGAGGTAPPADAAGRPPIAASASIEDADASTLHVDNARGIDGLLASVDDVVDVELVQLGVTASPSVLMRPSDRGELLRRMRAGGVLRARSVTAPPWPVIFFFRTRRHGTYAASLVGARNLRLYPDRRGEDGSVLWTSKDGEVVPDDPDGWLWNYMQRHFGPTHEKEYLAPELPSYFHLQPPSPATH